MSFLTKYFVDVGEAIGLFNALQWLGDMQFDSVDFVVDSKVTFDAFNSNRHDETEFGHVIISTCQNIFSSHFTNSKVEISRRQANVALHLLLYTKPRCQLVPQFTVMYLIVLTFLL
jgi:ribonuclease HI